MQTPRISFGCYVSSEHIYVAGGMNEKHEACDTVDRLCLKNNTWQELPSLPERMWSVSINQFNTYTLFAVGGITKAGSYLDTVYKLDLERLKQW